VVALGEERKALTLRQVPAQSPTLPTNYNLNNILLFKDLRMVSITMELELEN
jgi:hypothetical protein